MAMTVKEIKKRHFIKVSKEAPLIPCACGCRELIKSKDDYGRDKKYLNGHNGRKYEDPTQYKREWNHKNRDSRYEYKMEYYRKRKVELIQYKGGECVECSLKYNGTNGGLFQFHHRNPEEKEFQLGNNLTNFAKERIYKEVDKCDLLCGNCHLLIHSTKF